MTWNIEFTPKAKDQVAKLSENARDALRLLIKDLQTNGAAPGKGWRNYGKLQGQ